MSEPARTRLVHHGEPLIYGIWYDIWYDIWYMVWADIWYLEDEGLFLPSFGWAIIRFILCGFSKDIEEKKVRETAPIVHSRNQLNYILPSLTFHSF